MEQVKFTVFLFLLTIVGHAQEFTSGIVINDKDKRPLPFASVQIKNTKIGTITDEHGKFKVNTSNHSKDTLIISYLGFQEYKECISELSEFKTINLIPEQYSINEINVTEYTEKSIGNLMVEIFRYYRVEKNNKAKSFFQIKSYDDTIPLEIVEAFYNCNVSTKYGIKDLNLKMGRFAQNNEFNFYSLNTTNLITEYGLFIIETSSSIPLWPGKMNRRNIIDNYHLKIKQNDTSTSTIYFESKKANNNFNGSLTYNSSTKSIIKIELFSMNPLIDLKPIDKSHSTKFTNITFDIGFNPKQRELIKYLNFCYEVDYVTEKQTYKVSTKALLLNYDYETSFLEPVFSSVPIIKNDYVKIMTYGFDQSFWDFNYNMPSNRDLQNAINFLSNCGSLINYKASSMSLNHVIRNPLIMWSKEQRINWSDFNYDSYSFGINPNDIVNEKGIYTPSDLYNFDFSIFINPLFFSKKQIIISKVFMNSDNSYYFLKKDYSGIVLANIIFDYYHIESKNIDSIMKDGYQMLKVDSLFNNITSKKNMIILATEGGKNTAELIKFNDEISKRIGINNLDAKFNTPNGTQNNVHLQPNYYNIGTAYFLSGKSSLALEFMSRAYNACRNNEKQMKDILYNRAQIYFELNQKDSACVDLKRAMEIGDIESKRLFNEKCKK